jgi:hypothetical protein
MPRRSIDAIIAAIIDAIISADASMMPLAFAFFDADGYIIFADIFISLSFDTPFSPITIIAMRWRFADFLSLLPFSLSP